MPAQAQQYARLVGIVKDDAGKPIEGVEAALIATESGATYSATSNKKGKFTLTTTDITRAFDIQLSKEGKTDKEC